MLLIFISTLRACFFLHLIIITYCNVIFFVLPVFAFVRRNFKIYARDILPWLLIKLFLLCEENGFIVGWTKLLLRGKSLSLSPLTLILHLLWVNICSVNFRTLERLWHSVCLLRSCAYFMICKALVGLNVFFCVRWPTEFCSQLTDFYYTKTLIRAIWQSVSLSCAQIRKYIIYIQHVDAKSFRSQNKSLPEVCKQKCLMLIINHIKYTAERARCSQT